MTNHTGLCTVKFLVCGRVHGPEMSAKKSKEQKIPGRSWLYFSTLFVCANLVRLPGQMLKQPWQVKVSTYNIFLLAEIDTADFWDTADFNNYVIYLGIRWFTRMEQWNKWIRWNTCVAELVFSEQGEWLPLLMMLLCDCITLDDVLEWVKCCWQCHFTPFISNNMLSGCAKERSMKKCALEWVRTGLRSNTKPLWSEEKNNTSLFFCGEISHNQTVMVSWTWHLIRHLDETRGKCYKAKNNSRLWLDAVEVVSSTWGFEASNVYSMRVIVCFPELFPKKNQTLLSLFRLFPWELWQGSVLWVTPVKSVLYWLGFFYRL